jgi:hypothetical protein
VCIILLGNYRHGSMLLPKPRDNPESDFVLRHDNEVALCKFRDRNVGFRLVYRATQADVDAQNAKNSVILLMSTQN